MDALDAENLKALVSALAPGLIILAIRQRFIPGSTPSFQDRALAYAAISAVYYALSNPLMAYLSTIWRITDWFAASVEYVFLPVFLGLIFAVTVSIDLGDKVLRKLGLQPVHHVPAAWDYAFSRLRGNTYVIVTMSDGSQVAGHYSEGSFASSTDTERDLLIEDVWEVDPNGGPWTRAEPARSVLLCGRDIRSVELLRME